MKKKFGLVKRGNLYLLRKLTYPHFKAYVDLRKVVPEIKEIIFLEKCSVGEMAEAINEGGAYLDSVNPESDEYQMQEYLSRQSLLEKALSPLILISLLALKRLSGKTKLAFYVLVQLLVILNRK